MADIEVSNYDIHKQLYSQMTPIEEKEIEKEIKNVGAWFSTDPSCNYYMLMCKEISYYTVFHFNNMNYYEGTQELRECLDMRGQLIDIQYVHDQDAYEFWIKNEDDEIEMYYFFKYDWGVIEIGE